MVPLPGAIARFEVIQSIAIRLTVTITVSPAKLFHYSRYTAVVSRIHSFLLLIHCPYIRSSPKWHTLSMWHIQQQFYIFEQMTLMIDITFEQVKQLSLVYLINNLAKL